MIYFAKDSGRYKIARISEAAAGQSKEWERFYSLVDTYNPRLQFLVVIGLNMADRATEHWYIREPEIPPYKARIRA